VVHQADRYTDLELQPVGCCQWPVSWKYV